MSDELERKRQEKIANFKIDFGEKFAESNEISSSSASDSNTEEGTEALSDSMVTERIEDDQGDRHTVFGSEEFTDISSGNEEEDDSEINSYSSLPETDLDSIDKKSLRHAKKIDKKRRKKKAKKNRIIFRAVWITMVLFVSIMIGEFLIVGVNDFLGVDRSEGKVTITIPADADIDEITDILYDNKVINIKWTFKLFATVTKSTTGFTRGTFDIDTNKDYQAIINYMQSDMNRTDVVTLRFTEGMSLKQYAKLLENGNVCNADEFLQKCNSSDFDDYEFIKNINNSSSRFYKLEGYLFPDTYNFYVGENVDDVIRKFLANYRRKVYGTRSRAEGFEKKVTISERAEKLGMTMEDVLTLASLIQAEAANKDDMYIVSSILHNRLDTIKDGGVNDNGESGLARLQLDSTRYYPYASLTEIPSAERKNFKGKYSTYEYDGLPAGPICNPGLEAIEAALSPEKTDYYYFCHKVATEEEAAVAYYAKTMDEHLENLRKAGLM